MPWSISDHADSVYDGTQHPWDSLFNGTPSSDVYRQDPRQQRLMAQVRMTPTWPPQERHPDEHDGGFPVDAG
jgi:hypothetical protein